MRKFNNVNCKSTTSVVASDKNNIGVGAEQAFGVINKEMSMNSQMIYNRNMELLRDQSLQLASIHEHKMGIVKGLIKAVTKAQSRSSRKARVARASAVRVATAPATVYYRDRVVVEAHTHVPTKVRAVHAPKVWVWAEGYAGKAYAKALTMGLSMGIAKAGMKMGKKKAHKKAMPKGMKRAIKVAKRAARKAAICTVTRRKTMNTTKRYTVVYSYNTSHTVQLKADMHQAYKAWKRAIEAIDVATNHRRVSITAYNTACDAYSWAWLDAMTGGTSSRVHKAAKRDATATAMVAKMLIKEAVDACAVAKADFLAKREAYLAAYKPVVTGFKDGKLVYKRKSLSAMASTNPEPCLDRDSDTNNEEVKMKYKVNVKSKVELEGVLNSIIAAGNTDVWVSYAAEFGDTNELWIEPDARVKNYNDSLRWDKRLVIHYSDECVAYDLEDADDLLKSQFLVGYGPDCALLPHEGRTKFLHFFASAHFIAFYLCHSKTEIEVNKGYKYIRGGIGCSVFESITHHENHYGIEPDQRSDMRSFIPFSKWEMFKGVCVFKKEGYWATVCRDGAALMREGAFAQELRDLCKVEGQNNAGIIGIRVFDMDYMTGDGVFVKAAVHIIDDEIADLLGMEEGFLYTSGDNTKFKGIDIDRCFHVIAHSASKMKSGNISGQVLGTVSQKLVEHKNLGLKDPMNAARYEAEALMAEMVLLKGLKASVDLSIHKTLTSIKEIDNLKDNSLNKEHEVMVSLAEYCMKLGLTDADVMGLRLYKKIVHDKLESLTNKTAMVNFCHELSASTSVMPDPLATLPLGVFGMFFTKKMKSMLKKHADGYYYVLIYRSPAAVSGSLMLVKMVDLGESKFWKKHMPYPAGRLFYGAGLKELADKMTADLIDNSGYYVDPRELDKLVLGCLFHQTSSNTAVMEAYEKHLPSLDTSDTSLAKIIMIRGNGWDFDNDPAIMVGLSPILTEEEIASLEVVFGLTAGLDMFNPEAFIEKKLHKNTPDGLREYVSDVMNGVFGNPNVGPYALICALINFLYASKNGRDLLERRISEWNELMLKHNREDLVLSIKTLREEGLGEYDMPAPLAAAVTLLQASVDKKVVVEAIRKYFGFFQNLVYGGYAVRKYGKDGEIREFRRRFTTLFGKSCVPHHMFVRGNGPMTKEYQMLKTNGACAWAIKVSEATVSCIESDATGNVFIVPTDVSGDICYKYTQIAVVEKDADIMVAYKLEYDDQGKETKVPMTVFEKDKPDGWISIDVAHQYEMSDMYELEDGKHLGWGKDLTSQAYLYARDQIVEKVLPEFQNWNVGVNDTALPGALSNINKTKGGYSGVISLLTHLLRPRNSKIKNAPVVADFTENGVVDERAFKAAEIAHATYLKNEEKYAHLLPFSDFKDKRDEISNKYEASDFSRAWKRSWNETIDAMIKDMNKKGYDGVKIFGEMCLERAMTNNPIENDASFGAHPLVTRQVEGMEKYTTFHYCAAIMTPRIAEFMAKYNDLYSNTLKEVFVKVKVEDFDKLIPAMVSSVRQHNNANKWSPTALDYGTFRVYATEAIDTEVLFGPNSTNTKLGVIWNFRYEDVTANGKEYIIALVPLTKGDSEDIDLVDPITETDEDDSELGDDLPVIDVPEDINDIPEDVEFELPVEQEVVETNEEPGLCVQCGDPIEQLGKVACNSCIKVMIPVWEKRKATASVEHKVVETVEPAKEPEVIKESEVTPEPVKEPEVSKEPEAKPVEEPKKSNMKTVDYPPTMRVIPTGPTVITKGDSGNKAIWREILKWDGCVFLAGEGGTGKTTLINAIMDKNSWALTASTGIAATHIDGCTIHKFIGKTSNASFKSCMKKLKFKEKFNSLIGPRLRATKVIVIDEVSMIDPLTLAFIDEALKHAMRSSEMFGGKKIIFTGDFRQLECIQKDWGVSINHPELALTKISELGSKLLIVQLEVAHRQKDAKMLNMLRRVSRGITVQEDLDMLMSRREPFADNAINLFGTNPAVDSKNNEELTKLGIETKYVSNHVYIMPRNDMFLETVKTTKYELNEMEVIYPETLPLIRTVVNRELTVPFEGIELAVGARAMITENGESDMITGKNSYVNGDVGYIISIHTDIIVIKLDRTDKVVGIAREQLSIDLGEEDAVWSFCYFPIKLAYAFTVHKSQGMSLDAINVDIRSPFACGQLYVALSRCRSLEGIRLHPETSEANIVAGIKLFRQEVRDWEIKMYGIEHVANMLADGTNRDYVMYQLAQNEGKHSENYRPSEKPVVKNPFEKKESVIMKDIKNPTHYAGIGSRDISTEEDAIMKEIAGLLEKKGVILRSGHAIGADRAFEIGANSMKSEIYLPWSTYGQTPYGDDPGMKVIGKKLAGTLPNHADAEAAYNKYRGDRKESQGVKKLMMRNYHQIFGDGNHPSDFVVCCAKPLHGGHVEGGTGYAVQIALDNQIPVFNIRIKGDLDKLRKFINELPEKKVEKIHVFSGAKGVFGALTNPTELAFSKGNITRHYPITDKKGMVHVDAEAAFQYHKDKSEAVTKPSRENSKNYKLMVSILKAKFEQHDFLIDLLKTEAEKRDITVTELLKNCYHQPTDKNTVWETNGQNWFILALREAVGGIG